MQPGIAPLAVVVGWPLRCVKSAKKQLVLSSKIAKIRCNKLGAVSHGCVHMHALMHEGHVPSWYSETI